MDDIAERAGVSKPVLYQHFPGKLDLYLALLDQSCDTIIAASRDALESTHDNKQRVAATMDAFYAYVASAEGAFRLVFESDLTNEPGGARARRPGHQRVRRDDRHVIHDDTGLPEEQSRLLAVSLVGMAQVSARFWLADGGAADGWMTRERGGRPGRRPGLARHPRLPPHRRAPLTTPPTNTGGPPWRSRSACRTRPASSSSDDRHDAEDVEKQVAEAVSERRRRSPSPTPRADGRRPRATRSPTSRSRRRHRQVGFRG